MNKKKQSDIILIIRFKSNEIFKNVVEFFYTTSDCSLIEKSIQIEGLNFTRNGAISIGLISDFSDEFLEKHIGEDVILQILWDVSLSD